jgi:hypothetical protein
LDNAIDEWTGLPSIKERKAAVSMSMVDKQGNILDVGAKAVHATLEGVHVLRLG